MGAPKCRTVRHPHLTVFGVSTRNNGDVSGECSCLVSSGGAHCFAVLHLLFSTSSGRRNIHVSTISVFYISSTPFEPIPAQPKTRGTGDTLAFLSLLQTTLEVPAGTGFAGRSNLHARACERFLVPELCRAQRDPSRETAPPRRLEEEQQPQQER